MKMRKVFNEHYVMSPIGGASPGNPGLVNGIGVVPSVPYPPTQTRPNYEGGGATPFDYNGGVGYGATCGINPSEPARLPKEPPPKMLCRAPGCSYYPVLEYNGYCYNCFKPPH